MNKPLGKLLPDYRPDDVGMLARTLFSAVHGIILLGLEERLVAVPPQRLRRQIALFVDTSSAGLNAHGPSRPPP
jgi:hypothetical protein